MKILYSTLFTCLLLLSVSLSGYAQGQHIIQGHFIVQFYPGKGPANLFPAGDEIRPISIKKLSRPLNIWLLAYDMDANASVSQLKALRNNPAVALAQFDHKVQKREKRIPNDTMLAQQWNMHNTNISGFDVHALDAWSIATGGLTSEGDTIVIAVIDEGFDIYHQDIKYWKNYAEIPNNGIDDDKNGYIDDYDGWNATDTTGTIGPDNASHGTHVSGIAGARGNNKAGVAGVNWNVKILPIIHGDDESTIIASYDYVYTLRKLYNDSAGKRGAFIVATNSSFGQDNALAADHPIWCMMYDSMGHIGVLSAAATTNNNNDVDNVGDMPTTCSSEYMITVTDMSRYAQLSAGYGAKSIDIGAPGEEILSTYPSNTYGLNSGTSMATPHVAGAIALIYSRPCATFVKTAISRPAAAAMYVRNIILNNVDASSALDGKTTTGGTLNLYKCLQATDSVQCYKIDSSINKYQILSVSPNPLVGGNLHIVYSTEIGETAELYVTNVLGQAINHYTLPESSKAITQVNMPFYGLASGIYFLTISAKSGLMTKSIFVNGDH